MAIMNDVFQEARMSVVGRPTIEPFKGYWRVVLRQWREPHLFNVQPYEGPYGDIYWIKEEVTKWIAENVAWGNVENRPYVNMRDGHRSPDDWVIAFPTAETAFAFKMRWL